MNPLRKQVLETIPTLWGTARAWLLANPLLASNDSSLAALLVDSGGRFYGGCHFWSK